MEGGGWSVFTKTLLQRNLNSVSRRFHFAVLALNISPPNISSSNGVGL